MKIIKTDAAPEGLAYFPDFLSPDDEETLIHHVDALTLSPFAMRGVASRRNVMHFGWTYAYDAWTIEPTTPLPDFLLPIRERAAATAGLPAATFEAALINAYPVGAGIGWHRDAPMFGNCVLGISLRSACTMKFRRVMDGQYEVYAQPLAPRSLYIMAGPARKNWQHTIAPAKVHRYSITFRTVARKPRP